MDRVYNIMSLAKKLNNDIEQKDVSHARQIAVEILQMKPRNRSLMEYIAGVFIDFECVGYARETVNFLKKTFTFHPYWYVLEARIAEMDKDYEKVVSLSKKGLQTDLQMWQKAILYNILGRIYTEVGDIENAKDCYLKSSDLPNNPGKLADYSNFIFTSHYRPMSKQEMFKNICGYENLLKEIPQYEHKQRYNHDKIRLGYISPDFRYHIVAFFAYAMLKYYDKSRFMVYAYANCNEDNASRDLARYVDIWRNVYNCTADNIAKIIYRDEIDILVDLSGHTANNSLPVMAYKPAPVQVCGIGWFDSTGLSSVDYILSDVYASPIETGNVNYTEEILRMPQSHLCYMRHDNPSSKFGLPFLKNGYITFGSLNNFAKVTDEMLRVWAEILKRVPNSCLLLKSKVFDSEWGKQSAIKRIEQAGININCVKMQGYSHDYLSTYQDVDIALDTYPYPGGGTTCDALYMGVPVVTLVGETQHSRYGYSLLKNLNLDNLCAYSLKKYVSICCWLTENTGYLLELHKTLRWRMNQSPLMDTAGYMTELELLYEKILNIHKPYLTMDTLSRLLDAGAYDELIKQASICLLHCKSEGEKAKIWGMQGKAYLFSKKNNSLARAKYCLSKAAQELHGFELWECLSLLSEAAKELDDFILSYYAARKAMLMVEHRDITAPDELIENIYVTFAKAALTIGEYHESEIAYFKAYNFAKNNERKLNLLSSYILVSHYLPYSSAEIWERQRLYAEATSSIIPFIACKRKKRSHGKLKIGYISPDFRKHAMYPILYPMLAFYDKEKFHVSVYSLNKHDDKYTNRLREMVDSWRDVYGNSYEKIAQIIREDNIDILVDLASHSNGTGLPVLVYRPAYVQISGWGSLCSTGLKAVDYYVSDSVIDPPGKHDKFFAEKILYLPAQFSYYSGMGDIEVAGTPCRHREYIQLGCIQDYAKINDNVLTIWRDILLQVPEAHLLIKSISLASDSLKVYAFQRFKNMGLPVERIELEAGDDRYMERCLDIDIMLDTYPYPGGRTMLDALYMGVPVVTMYGERRNTRFGYSILKSVGLEELATMNKEEYIQIVVSLAKDKDLLDALHRQLRERLVHSMTASPKAYMNYLETKYLQIAEQKIFLKER